MQQQHAYPMQFDKPKTFESSFYGLEIDNSVRNGSYVRILHAVQSILHCMTHRQKIVTAWRFDLHFPRMHPAAADNATFKSFFHKLIVALRTGGNDTHYLWVREQEPLAEPFYRCLILTGDPCILPSQWFSDVRARWAMAIGEQQADHLVCMEDDACTILNRDEPNFQEICRRFFYVASSLARADTKPFSPRGCHQYARSRINRGPTLQQGRFQ